MAIQTRTYSSTTDVITGATIAAAHINTDLDKLYTLQNGNIDNDNIAAGAAIAISKTALGTYTAWTTWSPTRAVAGGTVPTYTAEDVSRYTQTGNTVKIQCIWSNAAAGTAGNGANSLTFTLPVNAANIGATTFRLIGQGIIFNDGLLNEAISVRILSATTAGFYLSSVATTNISGNNQNQVIRRVIFEATYEVA